MNTNNNMIGCYGDGALGHKHTRKACANVLEHYAKGKSEADLRSNMVTVEVVVKMLRGTMSDDAWEEYQACEWLNDHAPIDGAYWGWENGDFGLWADVETA